MLVASTNTYRFRKPFTSRLLSTMTLSVSVVSFMFIFTYIPQGTPKFHRALTRGAFWQYPVTVLFFTSGPFAPFSAILLILSESSTIINMLARSFLIREALDDTFDAVLLTKNEDVLVSSGRQLNKSTDPISRVRICKPLFLAMYTCWWTHSLVPPLKTRSITLRQRQLSGMIFTYATITAVANRCRYVMYLPLNFIPVVGTITFLILQGRSRGTCKSNFSRGMYIALTYLSSCTFTRKRGF